MFTLNTSLSTIIFGHFPCPDGLSAMTVLVDKFGLIDNATYAPLNHDSDNNMWTSIQKALNSQPLDADVVFVDIAPPIQLVKKLIDKTQGSVTILDHHKSALDEYNDPQNKILIRDCLNSKRLTLILNLDKSGLGLAFDYVNQGSSKPWYIILIEAIDLYNADFDISVLEKTHLIFEKLTTENQHMLEDLKLLSNNPTIKQYTSFFVCATAVDAYFQRLFKHHDYQLSKSLILEVKKFFNYLDETGINGLLSLKFQDKEGNNKNVARVYQEEIEYQQSAISKAVVIPSPLRDNLNILFVKADIKRGRTFGPLLQECLQTQDCPTFAMLTETNQESISNKNSVSLRNFNNQINLLNDVALKYLELGLAISAGGHSKAAGVHFDKTQFLKFLNVVHQAQFEEAVEIVT